MQCIKCEEGVLKTIRFKRSGQIAFACDYCATFWMKGEIVKYNTGHSLNPYAPGDDYEYAVQELNAWDQDHQPVRNVRRI
jgi:hypothetical protein